MLYKLLFVGFGGFIGSCMRFCIALWLSALPMKIPYGTLLANVLAGFLIGLFLGAEGGFNLPESARLFLSTGLLGGLSTFSTFSLETIKLFKSGTHLHGLLNITLNLGLSLFGVMAGAAVSKQLARLFY